MATTSGDGPLAAASLGEIVVYVDDLAAMRSFYVDTLGLAVAHEAAGALVGRGVDAPVERRPYGTYARLRDPEGNVVGLEQARGARAGA